MKSARKRWVGYLAALGGVALVTALYKVVIPGVNATTIAVSLLLVVLVAASAYGLGPGIASSLAGMLCLNFFFLPPFGTLTIHDPQNWVALFAFLVTAGIASQLSAAARARARDAEHRREEVWKLYELSRAIIATPDSESAVSSIARQVVEVFGLTYCAVFAPNAAEGWLRLAVAGEPAFEPQRAEVEGAFRSGKISFPRGRVYAPLKVGTRPVGVMVLVTSSLERGTVEAIAGLVALALERARFLKEISRTEALRQSDELKSALLASVSHDLRTPLTSIRVAVDNLLQEEIEWDKDVLREFHLIISEEVHRLTSLIQNLLEMARIEAGELRLSKRWAAVSEIVANVLERSSASLRNHRVVTDVAEDLPLVSVDTLLVTQALANVVENAAKYSPAASRIVVRGGVGVGELHLSVEDEGPGIAPEEAARVFDKFYRGERPSDQRGEGTGMGLAIARGIIEAHGGKITVASAPGRGSTFTMAVPVEQKDAAAPTLVAGEV